MKLNATVYGSPPDVWQILLAALYAREYKVESQSPHTTLSASRGSKLTSMLLEGTKGGYRDLAVTFTPQAGNAIAVEFDFRFPSWAITYSDTKQECEAMVAQFATAAAQPGAVAALVGAPSALPASPAPSAFTPQVDASGTTCKACGAVVRAGARFCDACGSSLNAEAACPKCGAPLVPGGAFCERCGARAKP